MICAKNWLSFESVSKKSLFYMYDWWCKCYPIRWLHFMQNHSWKTVLQHLWGKVYHPLWTLRAYLGRTNGPLLMIVRFYSSSLYLFFVGTMSDDLAFLSPIFHLPIISNPFVSNWLSKQGFGNMINVNGWWNLLVTVSWLSTNGWCWWWGMCLW